MKKFLGFVATALLLMVGLTPAVAAATFSGSATSQIIYEDIFDGPVKIEIIHPTAAKCIKAFSNDVGYPCETEVQVRVEPDDIYASLYVFDENGDSVGSVIIGDDEPFSSEWQTATLYISEPDYVESRTYEYTIGVEWFEEVISSQVTPIEVTWGSLPKLAAVGSKKVTLKNTKVFKSGSTIELNTNYKAPKNGCAVIGVKYKISSRAISGYYNHAIVLEDSKGNVAAGALLRTEDDGYRGTAQLVVCSAKWWFDDENQRIAVKPGKYKVVLWEWDDYYISFGKSPAATITFKK